MIAPEMRQCVRYAPEIAKFFRKIGKLLPLGRTGSNSPPFPSTTITNLLPASDCPAAARLVSANRQPESEACEAVDLEVLGAQVCEIIDRDGAGTANHFRDLFYCRQDLNPSENPSHTNPFSAICLHRCTLSAILYHTHAESSATIIFYPWILWHAHG